MFMSKYDKDVKREAMKIAVNSDLYFRCNPLQRFGIFKHIVRTLKLIGENYANGIK